MKNDVLAEIELSLVVEVYYKSVQRDMYNASSISVNRARDDYPIALTLDNGKLQLIEKYAVRLIEQYSTHVYFPSRRHVTVFTHYSILQAGTIKDPPAEKFCPTYHRHGVDYCWANIRRNCRIKHQGTIPIRTILPNLKILDLGCVVLIR